MEPGDWSRIRALFERALDLPPEQREAFVEGETGGDDALRSEVRRLLRSEQPWTSFLDPPSDAVIASHLSSWRPDTGDAIGAFRIERSLGGGGMGTVYACRQSNPSRVVALKLMRSGLGSPRARRRFEVEAEILGSLQHPGIAAIYEAGVHRSPDGKEVPYFAMEHVEGARDIVGFAREEGLDLRRRVELLAAVCAAVHHAHQRGVIHRDLKPANVLVDAGGRPKVIDYGVARVTEPGIAAAPHTLTGDVFGTLAYMSPEQLAGPAGEVDTRADVYALGVILYELLTGRTPHGAGPRPIQELVAEICGGSPAPPSRLSPGVPRDLDWIALKALDVDRDQRYGSAAGLAEDLQRFLRDEPVLAGRPSRRYRLAKFVVRHRASVAAGTLAVASLIGGMVATSVQAHHASLAAAAAEAAGRAEAEQAEKARLALRRQTAVVDALRGIFGAVQAHEDGRHVTLFELLERQRPRLDTEFGDDPDLRASLQSFLGAAYDALGLDETAISLLESAVATMAESPHTDPAQLAWLQVMLARMRTNQGRFAEAQALFDAAIPVLREATGPRSREVLVAMRIHAGNLVRQGFVQQAATALATLVDLMADALGEEHADTLKTMGQLATQLGLLRRCDEAEQVARRAHEIAVGAVPAGHPLTLVTEMDLANVLVRRGKLDEAIERLRHLLGAAQEVFGEHHRNAILTHKELALALSHRGEHGPARAEAKRAVELIVAHLATDVVVELHGRIALAEVLEGGGDREAALAELGTALQRANDSGMPDRSASILLRWDIARLELDLGRPQDAAEHAAALLADLQSSNGGRRHIALSRALLGRALGALGEHERAAEELRASADEIATWSDLDLAPMRDLYFDTAIAALAATGQDAARARVERVRALR